MRAARLDLPLLRSYAASLRDHIGPDAQVNLDAWELLELLDRAEGVAAAEPLLMLACAGSGLDPIEYDRRINDWLGKYGSEARPA